MINHVLDFIQAKQTVYDLVFLMKSSGIVLFYERHAVLPAKRNYITFEQLLDFCRSVTFCFVFLFEILLDGLSKSTMHILYSISFTNFISFIFAYTDLFQ